MLAFAMPGVVCARELLASCPGEMRMCPHAALIAFPPCDRTRLPDSLPPSFAGTAVQYSYLLEARVQTSASSPLNEASLYAGAK